MTVEEFAAGPAQSDLLKKEEVVEIFLHFTVNPKVNYSYLIIIYSNFELVTNSNFQPKLRFPDQPRCCHTGKEEVVSRFTEYASRFVLKR